MEKKSHRKLQAYDSPPALHKHFRCSRTHKCMKACLPKILCSPIHHRRIVEKTKELRGSLMYVFRKMQHQLWDFTINDQKRIAMEGVSMGQYVLLM
ncbi:hypothetical protein CEXT_514431, partial [Caerostris extrusa]